MKYTDLKSRRLLPIVIVVMLVPAALAGAKIMSDPIKPWMKPTEWKATEGNIVEPNLKVRGLIVEFVPNYSSTGGWVSYHIFPAMIMLNETETLWISNPSWDNLKSVRVGYDYEDLPDLALGMSVEVYGYWVQITDTPYSFMIFVGPPVNGSYLKPLT